MGGIARGSALAGGLGRVGIVAATVTCGAREDAYRTICWHHGFTAFRAVPRARTWRSQLKLGEESVRLRSRSSAESG